jgi:hypothetical protein
VTIVIGISAIAATKEATGRTNRAGVVPSRKYGPAPAPAALKTSPSIADRTAATGPGGASPAQARASIAAHASATTLAAKKSSEPVSRARTKVVLPAEGPSALSTFSMVPFERAAFNSE